MPASRDDTSPPGSHAWRVDTAAAISHAMTDYLLAFGTNKAPASQAPAHMAAWLKARGYHLVRVPSTGPVDPGDPDQVARIAEAIDWHSTVHEDGARHAVVRQILAAVETAATVEIQAPRVA